MVSVNINLYTSPIHIHMYNEKPRRPRVIYPPRENRKSGKYVLLSKLERRKKEECRARVIFGMERGCSVGGFFLLSLDVSFFPLFP